MNAKVTSQVLPTLNLAAFKLQKKSAVPFVARIPGSKSYTNRALIIAAQKVGRTELVGALHCEDTELLAQCLDGFRGLSVKKTEKGFLVVRDSDTLGAPAQPLYVGGGGTPARLLISFAAMVDGETIIDGNARLRERPMGDLLDTLREMGVHVECLHQPGCLPVRVRGGAPKSDRWAVNGSQSSQFLTSLLLLAAQQNRPITIDVNGDLVSKSYVDMTLAIMSECGLHAEKVGALRYLVQPGKPTASEIKIEVDASAMSYFLGAAAITATTVFVPGISRNSKQGDAGFADLMEKIGAHVVWHPDALEVTGGDRVRGVMTSMDTMPDTVLTLAVVASQGSGGTRVSNIANLKIKECDRIHAIEAELTRVGIAAKGGDDYVEVSPGAKVKPALVQTYNDHRVAMAFSLLGLIHDGIEIQNPKCVEKSFPEYWTELTRFVEHHNCAQTQSCCHTEAA